MWAVRCSACGDEWEFDYGGNDQDGNDTRMNPRKNMDADLRAAERALSSQPSLDNVRSYVRTAMRSGADELDVYDRALVLMREAPDSVAGVRLVNEAAFMDQPEDARRRWYGRLMLVTEGDRRMAMWSPAATAWVELVPAGEVFEYAADRLDDVGYVRVIMRSEDEEEWPPEYLARELGQNPFVTDAEILASTSAIAAAADQEADGAIPPENWSGWLMTRLARALDIYINGPGDGRAATEIVYSRLAVGADADEDAVEEIEEEAGGFENEQTVMGALGTVLEDAEFVEGEFAAERTTYPGAPKPNVRSGQPVWREVGRLGDVNPIEHGGAIVYEDAGGAYPPEMELIEPDGRRVLAYRVVLEPHTWRGGVLSDNPFHPEHPAWYAARIAEVAESTGGEVQDLIRALRGRDAMAKARAYQDMIGFFGAHEFDDSPLRLTRREAEERYRAPGEEPPEDGD